MASAAFQEAAGLTRERQPQEEWIRVDDVRDEARSAVNRGSTRVSRQREPEPARRGRPPRSTPAAGELQAAVGAAQAPKLGQRLAEATRAFDRERYQEARKLLKPLAERAPGAPAIRELHGLTLYRLGQWRAAAKELEAFRTLTGSTEQHPVLADCYRALKRYDEVDELWQELRAASPSADLVTEGRIVAAGAMADRGHLAAAIALLEAGAKTPKKPKLHHLRLTYALADLVERAGDVPRARQLFRQVVTVDPDFADASVRLRALG